MMMKRFYWVILLLSLTGLADTGYLTYEHYARVIPPCSTKYFFVDCGKVLTSSYSIFIGQPLSLWGIFHYSFILLSTLFILLTGKKIWQTALMFFASLGFLVSSYLLYLQVVMLKAFCFYCIISALDSLIIFIISYCLILRKPQI